ncbi:MAG: HAD family hydrolase [Saprospiraceae bacterium]|nr:HAD family hydrolase [Saprospiraceae bacterium]
MAHFLADLDKDWTLFLDRDGVINRKLEADYVKSISEFDLLPGVLEALYLLDPFFVHIVVVTNQQGIGKGLMTVDGLSWIHKFLFHELENAKARIDAVYYCPHLSAIGCSCRKPAPGMAIAAKNDFPSIDFNKSIIVGDSISDMQFGRNLGMKTVFCSSKPQISDLIDLNVSSLKQFADILMAYQS